MEAKRRQVGVAYLPDGGAQQHIIPIPYSTQVVFHYLPRNRCGRTKSEEGLTFYREAATGPAAMARTNTSACCNWKSVAGFVGSDLGQPTGGSLGICCATAGK